MKTKKTEPFDFHRLQARDGLRIEEVTAPDGELSVHLVCAAEGQLVNVITAGHPDQEQGTVELAAWSDPGPRERGECARAAAVLQAVTRYLNAGGNWGELTALLGGMRRAVAGGLATPGWYYVGGEPVYLRDQDLITYQHTFRSDTDQGDRTWVALWGEDAFILLTTMDELRAGAAQGRADDEEEGGLALGGRS